MASCSACGKEIVWALSTNGASSPIEIARSDDGNVLVLMPRGLGHPLAVVLSKDALELARERGLPLHANHFQHCPQAESFRKSG